MVDTPAGAEEDNCVSGGSKEEMKRQRENGDKMETKWREEEDGADNIA